MNRCNVIFCSNGCTNCLVIDSERKKLNVCVLGGRGRGGLFGALGPAKTDGDN